MGMLFLTGNKRLEKLICIFSIIFKFLYSHILQLYQSIDSIIESESLSLQSNGKLHSLDHDRIHYITLTAH